MNHKLILGILITCSLLLCSACKHKKESAQQQIHIELNEQTVTDFAKSIVESVYNGNAELLNNAIDKEHIKSLISGNSIVYSGFDVEGGQKYFESCLRLGDIAVQTVNDGGVFDFVNYYKKDGKHHVIFRTYNDFIINFSDYVVDTIGGKIKIQDGFIYNTGSLLSKNVEYSMLYNLMLQTNPESDVQWLQKAENLTKMGSYAQSLSTLKEHKEALKEYPLYHQLYIADLYKTNAKNFDSQLDLIKDEIDERYYLLHKLLYYTNEGNPLGAEQTINALIPHSGDDPIFLLMYAKAEMENGNYGNALTCLKSAENALPLFWDFWACKMKCLAKTNDVAGYSECVQQGKEAFGLSDEEIKKMGF